METECQKTTYVIRQGDNLYMLAREFNTTVNMLLRLNPDIDPYNLQIGDKIIVCMGESKSRPCLNCEKQMELYNQFRLRWSQHVYWTRMLVISIAERLKDQNDTATQLLKNPDNMAKIFAAFYPQTVARKISELLTEHLQIGGELITALRDKRMSEAATLDAKWYVNADRMADAFASINPYYNREEVRKMLYSHLDLTKQEVSARLAGNFAADIKAFDKIEEEAMMMADFFASGIIKQFPQKFAC